MLEKSSSQGPIEPGSHSSDDEEVEVLGSKRTDEKYDAFWNIDMIYLFMQANDCPARTALELALTAKDLSPDDINLRNLFNELKGASLGFGINFDTLKNQYLRTATFKDLPNAADLATQAAIMVLAELTTLTQAIKSGGDQAVMEARAEMAFKRIKKWRFHGVLQGIVANDGAYEVQVEAERNEKIALRIQKKIEKAKGKNEWLLLGELPAVGATKSSSKSKSAPQGDASSLSKQLSLAGSSAAIIREKAHTPTDRDELTIRLQSLDDLVERTVKDFNKAEEVMLALVQDVKSLKGDITEINTLLESELESIRTELNAFNVRPGDFEVGVLG